MINMMWVYIYSNMGDIMKITALFMFLNRKRSWRKQALKGSQ